MVERTIGGTPTTLRTRRYLKRRGMLRIKATKAFKGLKRRSIEGIDPSARVFLQHT